MHTADNAVITKDDDTFVSFRPRCPKCGHVNDSYFGEKTEAVNATGETWSSGHKCPNCGESFRITFYGR